MSTRFAVAVHILTFLESTEGRPASSELIAGSVNTNPSLIRKLLGALTDAGLTRSRLGAGGGALLAKPASAITLLDAWRAAGESAVFELAREAPNPDCPVGRNIKASLEAKLTAATKAMEASLEATTIADMLRDVEKQEKKRRRAS